MMPYVENPKDATRKLLDLINGFGKVAVASKQYGTGTKTDI